VGDCSSANSILLSPKSYSSSPRTRQTVTVSRNTWFQRCSQGSGIRRCKSRQEERCCRMDPHGDSLCDDVLFCLIAQSGRQAGQPNHRQRVRSPLTAPAVKERFWLCKQPPRTCRVNCGCIIVLKSTRPAHTWGEAVTTQSLRKAFFCRIQPSCVHDRERDHKIVV